ncbi:MULTISPECIES: GNAT family N-acetyltransferase [unclassified Frankia]|uniref:GNAT family N-acetyltransferase n=1 Tax=unclassified Frankia TaxID=2632575 RepID=UPI002024FB93
MTRRGDRVPRPADPDKWDLYAADNNAGLKHPIGCVGLAPRPPASTAEIKRLYVRPTHRGGIGRVLMEHAHQHAARHRFTRLVLDALPTRTAVISFHRRLGYTDIEPYDTESPIPMIYMQRPVTQT